MKHPRCRSRACRRLILPGQRVVWIPPATRGDGRVIVAGAKPGWSHAEHLRPGPMRVTYAEDLDSVAVRRQLMRVWEEKHRPLVTDQVGRRRFDEACVVQIADIRTRVRPERRPSHVA